MKKYYRLLPALLVLILGVSTSVWVQFMHNSNRMNTNNNKIVLEIANKSGSIQQELAYCFSSVELIRFLSEKQVSVSKQEFQDLTSAIFQGNSSIKAISWVPKVSEEERNKFESIKRQEYNMPLFAITQLNDQNKLINAEKRAYYFPVEYIAPLSENRTALGYDIFSDSIRKATIIDAINKRELQITPRIKLVQDTSGYSFLAIMPVLNKNDLNLNVTSLENVKGIVSTVFKVDKLIDNALVRTEDSNIELAIYDITNSTRDLIYGNKLWADQSRQLNKRIIAVGGRNWELDFSTDISLYQLEDKFTYFLLGVSLSFLLLALLVHPILKKERNRIFKRKLDKEQAVRLETEHSLSESEEYNRVLFNTTSIGLALCKMDGALVDINPAFANIIGCTIYETRQLNYWEITPEKYADQEVEQLKRLEETGNFGPYEKEYIHKDGRLIPVSLQGKIMVRNGIKYIWSSVEDITERKKAEVQLNVANEIISRSPVVAFLWRNEEGWPVEFVSDNIEKLTGYTVDEFTNRKIAYNDIIHINDIVKVGEEVAHFSKLAETKSFTHEPYRIITKTGEIKWINDITFIRRNSEGIISHYEGIVYDITEGKMAEEKLMESEERYRLLFYSNPSPMWVYDLETLFFLEVNQAAVHNYGYSEEEFLQMTLKDIRPKQEVDKLLEDINQKRPKLQNSGEWVHQTKDGTIIDVEIVSHQIEFNDKNAVLVLANNITERKQAEKDLYASKIKLESIFRVAPTGIGVSVNRIFTEVNNRFCEMTGYSQNELIGKDELILFPSGEEYERIGKEVFSRVKESKTVSVETRFKQKTGSIIDVLLSFTPYDMHYPSADVTFTALNITDRNLATKELEKHRNHLEEIVEERTRELGSSQNALLNLVDDINRQSAKLAKSNTNLAAVNEELETFTYSVSHDLKAPLRGIDGYSQLLLDTYYDELNEEAREFLTNIRYSAQQMNALIEDLLAYSRMERQDYRMEKVHFKALVDNLLLFYSKTIKARKVKIKISFKETVMPIGDKDGLNLVLRNLLDNAIKFTFHNKRNQIEIGANENDSRWLIFVKDNGIGFDMKYHDKIFKIFHRLHLAEEYEGTGIGLAMVSKAAQRMNGKIWAESEPGKGSSFYLEIKKN